MYFYVHYWNLSRQVNKDRSRNNWHILNPPTLPSPQGAEGTADSYFSNDPKQYLHESRSDADRY
jgi:hypothetical protein